MLGTVNNTKQTRPVDAGRRLYVVCFVINIVTFFHALPQRETKLATSVDVGWVMCASL